MSSGTSDKIKGRVEEAVGVITDNQRLKDQGKLDQAAGKMKKGCRAGNRQGEGEGLTEDFIQKALFGLAESEAQTVST